MKFVETIRHGLMISSLVALANFPALASDAAPLRAEIALEAQLWKRPAGAGNRLKFTLLGEATPVEAKLEYARGRDTAERTVEGGELSAEILFLIVQPRAPERPFVSTQTQIYHRDFGLIAECANYDSVEGEFAIGVGVCSGVVDGVQYGISFSKPGND
jgi:hypothetical protein